MADIHVRTCFAFCCTGGEWSLLRAAFSLALDLLLEIEPDDRSPALMALFPPDADDRWAGFSALFDDPAYPDFGAELSGGPHGDAGRWQAVISADTSLDPMAVARLIQRCCAASLARGPIGFEWAMTCSRQRIGEFGGGWCAVVADRIEIEATGAALSMALAEAIV